ncbi:MAG: ribulose-phosphate 3-epimerase [Candidatus Cloacimonadota bacterium]|nr:ribulose-phosphate 3-epimerase [Candidatus Cloacimonadota bacterium]
MKLKIAPSLLSANLLNLEREIKNIEKAGADMLHLDIMDGHFVPNLTFGPELVKQIRKTTNLPLDTHLMVTNPAFFIPKFLESGVDYISFHIETNSKYEKLLNAIKKSKVKAGVAINPETPLNTVGKILDYIDYVLIMTVHPGFGGQEFIADCTPKIQELHKIVGKRKIEIEVDGGINYQTAKLVKEAGANIIVAGNFIFNSKNYKKVIEGLRNV